MEWIEIIHLKSYTGPDRDKAVEAFNQLTAPVRVAGLGKITLYHGLDMDNELCIFLAWDGAATRGGKSPLGVQLSAAFSEFGHIYHAGWKHRTDLQII